MPDANIKDIIQMQYNKINNVNSRLISENLPSIQESINRQNERYNNAIDSRNTSQNNCNRYIHILTGYYYTLIDKYLDYLNTQYLYQTQYDEFYLLTEIKKRKIIEYKKIKNKIDSYKNNVNKDNTNYLYNKDNLEFVNYIYYIILIIYYSLFVLFLIFSNFIKNEDYKNRINIVIILLYLTFPFVTKYILRFCYYIYNYIIEIYNLKDEKISYDDIIKYDTLNSIDNQTQFI